MLTRYHDDRSPAFELLPAIDLVDGRVVRLEQGDFGRETAYGQDAVETARSFAADGARWLHVVDLDGAREGRPRQLAVIGSICDAVGDGVLVEVAGGLRSHDTLDEAAATGAARLVIGTAALRDPAFAAMAVARLGAARVAVAIDVRDGLAVGEAWRSDAGGVPAIEAVRRLADAGVTTFEVTAVARDGLLGGPDLDLLASIVGLDRGRVIASGGVGSPDDLRAVRRVGCAGAIVGRALYEGRMSVPEALAAVDR